MLGYGIKETTTTTGTGTLTLSSVTGYPRFSNVFPVGAPVYYSLLDSNGAPLESGIGTVAASNTLTRDRILATYASSTYDDLTATALSLTGTTTVICTGAASSFQLSIPNINSVNTFGGFAIQRKVLDTRLNLNSVASTGFTVTANRLYLVPFYLAFDCIATGITLRVGTGVAGTNIRAGLYSLDHRGFPTFIDESGPTSSATSNVNLEASFAANHKLTSGMYVIAFVSDGAPALGSVTSNLFFNHFGVPAGTNIITPVSYAYQAHTFGALPTTISTALNAAGVGAFPCVGLTIV